jgi:agmatine deiminase
MPAEWEPHAGTWLAWPHHRPDWPGKLEIIWWVYAEIIRALTRHEPVNLIHFGPNHDSIILDRLQKSHVNMKNVRRWRLPTDRSWMRDCGPIFIVNDQGGKIALDWRFNAWAKYDNWLTDDQIPARLCERLKVDTVQPMYKDHRVVLEGGSIDVNGQGLLLTTEECLLSKTQERNPPMRRAAYERVFSEYLGVKKTLWLGKGIAGDDTHGHVDDLARFVSPRTIVAVEEKNTADENYKPLQENLERLRGMTDRNDQRFEVASLPMPSPLYCDGVRLPASYANFYIANGVVIVPTFNDPMDRTALGILAELFPDREVVGIHCVDLVWGLGTLHCMTQQEPKSGLDSGG